jgi:hypothetical protein
LIGHDHVVICLSNSVEIKIAYWYNKKINS